ncbi:hypothetical protein [Nocardioides zeae]
MIDEERFDQEHSMSLDAARVRRASSRVRDALWALAQQPLDEPRVERLVRYLRSGEVLQARAALGRLDGAVLGDEWPRGLDGLRQVDEGEV